MRRRGVEAVLTAGASGGSRRASRRAKPRSSPRSRVHHLRGSGLLAFDIDFRHAAGEFAHTGNQSHTFRNTDRATSVEDVEQVGALQTKLINLPQWEPLAGTIIL